MEDAGSGLAKPGESQEARRPCLSSPATEGLRKPEGADEEQQARDEERGILYPYPGSQVEKADGIAGDREARSRCDLD
jgi:hypothetical protein